jgi:hypothetical protein
MLPARTMAILPPGTGDRSIILLKRNSEKQQADVNQKRYHRSPFMDNEILDLARKFLPNSKKSSH